MKVNIIFIPDNDSIPEKDLEFIKKLMTKHAEKVVGLLPFKNKNLTFTVYAWNKKGVSGFTKAVDWILININYRQFFRQGLPDEKILDQLTYIVYHEMHHACRGYAQFLPKNKEHILINSIISEGLADHFAREQFASQRVLKDKNYNWKEIKGWIKKLGKVMWQKESVDESWIFGGQGKPKLLGYQIGRYIIQKVKDNNPKLNSINLLDATSERIIKLSKVDF
jgi:uncharacterized protein YjaZ